MLKTHKILPVFAILAFIVILMPFQEANAGAPPTITAAATVTTTTISVTFSEAVFNEGGTTTTDYNTCFRVGAQTPTVDALPITPIGADTVVILTVATAFGTGDTPNVDYTVANCGPGGSIAHVAAAQEDLATDDTTAPADGVAPTMDSATVTSASTIDVTFSEDLTDVEAGDFTLNLGLTVINTVETSPGVVTLTTTELIADGATPLVTLAADGVDDVTTGNVLGPGPTLLAFTTAVSQAGQGSGCRSDCQAPTLGVNSEGDRFVTNGFTYNGKSTSVESFYTPYPLITANVGQQNKAVFKIYDNYGPQNIAHFSLAFGLGNDQIISESKAMIELDIDFDGTETVTITDPENALENVRVRTSTGNCNSDSAIECLIVTIVHTFRAPLDFNMVGTDVWDTRLNSWQNYYNHGIEVVGESLNPPNEYFGIYKGELIHLIETAKNTVIDADGNTWTFDNTWIKDYIYNGKIVDPITSQGYDRNHVKFNAIMQDQEQIASSLFEKYYKTSVSQEPTFEEINDIYPTYVSQGFDRNHPDFAAYKQEQVRIALSFLKQHFPEYTSESFEKINNIYSYEYSEQNEQDSVTKKHNINQEIKKAQQTIQEYYKSSYQ